MQHMPRLNRGKGAATRYLEEKGMGKGSPLFRTLPLNKMTDEEFLQL